MLVLCGIPLLYMEMAVGQFTQQGPIGALAKLCPLLKGTLKMAQCLGDILFVWLATNKSKEDIQNS